MPHDWAVAKEILLELFDRADAKVEIGQVRYLVEGLFQKGHGAFVEVTPDPEGYPVAISSAFP